MVHLDISGGEPSASANYADILARLPESVQSVRVNTNGSRIIPELAHLVERGVEVTVTVSLDGIGAVHDRVRWPVRWDTVYGNLMHYQRMNLTALNCWTTVSAVNIHDFETIREFVIQHQLDHSWAFLHDPDPLNVRYSNTLTRPYHYLFPEHVAVDRDNQHELDSFLQQELLLRGIE